MDQPPFQIFPGTCLFPKPDAMYAIFQAPTAGYGLGIIIRGSDANWSSGTIVAHAELPLSFSPAQARIFRKTGKFPPLESEAPHADSAH